MSDHLTLVPDSKKMPEKKEKLTDAEVLAYLRDNPSFMTRHPDVIDLLKPDVKTEKGVADFQSYMIERLKADKQEVMDATRELVENARSNMTNWQRIQDATLRLLEAKRFDDFIHTITMDLAPMMGVDIAVFLVETAEEGIPHIDTSGIRLLPSGTIDRWMGEDKAMLQDNIMGIEPIYGGGAKLVQSQLLLRVDISMGTPPAVIAFGSRAPDMFAPNQSTEQISFLARVIERCFRLWLDI